MKINLPQHFKSLSDALSSLFGSGISVRSRTRISGGDINEAYALVLSDGQVVFMKSNSHTPEDFFKAEAAGLSAIASTKTIQTPEILCTGSEASEYGSCNFLLLKYVESRNPRDDFWETFARNLAALHNANTECFFESDGMENQAGKNQFGFFQDNYIGERPQRNTPCESWISFFREMRLAPQFKYADRYFTDEQRKSISHFLDHLDDFLIEGKPSLLHGDLWSGNVMCGPDGNAMLIDPATYVGLAEADIAMTELFGGFPPAFYGAYKEIVHFEPGYELRRDIYNLYQLLNHLNLFGHSYLPSVLHILRKF